MLVRISFIGSEKTCGLCMRVLLTTLPVKNVPIKKSKFKIVDIYIFSIKVLFQSLELGQYVPN